MCKDEQMARFKIFDIRTNAIQRSGGRAIINLSRDERVFDFELILLATLGDERVKVTNIS